MENACIVRVSIFNRLENWIPNLDWYIVLFWNRWRAKIAWFNHSSVRVVTDFARLIFISPMLHGLTLKLINFWVQMLNELATMLSTIPRYLREIMSYERIYHLLPFERWSAEMKLSHGMGYDVHIKINGNVSYALYIYAIYE